MFNRIKLGVPAALIASFVGLAMTSIGIHPIRADADQKVTICHIPPGNPDNAHLITVSQNAVAAHLAHGDVLSGSSFSFYSGAATASFGAGGNGPITTGLGAIGGSDPVTEVAQTGNPATIIAKNGAWSLIAGTQWVSFANTTTAGPANGAVFDFEVDFNSPCGGTVQIEALADDAVTAYVNGSQVGPTPLANFTVVGTTSAVAIPGLNTVRFAVVQTGGDGYGLDYRVTVTSN